MKLGKKLMVVAMAVATFGLVGCNMNEDEFHMIDLDAPAGTANICYTNASDNQFTRGWRTFNTKHQDADCIIRFKKPADNNSNGNMGYIFNMKKNNDGSISFDTVTVGYKSDKAEGLGLYYYASKYENVGKDYINGNLSNFADIEGKVIDSNNPAASKATESSLDGNDSQHWNKLEISPDSDGYYNVFIDLDWESDDGKYKVTISKADYDSTKKVWESGKSLKTINKITLRENKNNPQYSLGAYAMAIKEKTVEGDWIFTNFTKEPIVLEEIDF